MAKLNNIQNCWADFPIFSNTFPLIPPSLSLWRKYKRHISLWLRLTFVIFHLPVFLKSSLSAQIELVILFFAHAPRFIFCGCITIQVLLSSKISPRIQNHSYSSKLGSSSYSWKNFSSVQLKTRKCWMILTQVYSKLCCFVIWWL